MIVIRNNIIPFKGYKCINICGILFARKNANIDDVTMNHEAIHSRQIWECLVVFFYLIYVINWLVNLFRYKFVNKTAYRNILYEREAYANEKDMEYLSKRKWFAWVKC